MLASVNFCATNATALLLEGKRERGKEGGECGEDEELFIWER
jgi:hypothetical protein